MKPRLQTYALAAIAASLPPSTATVPELDFLRSHLTTVTTQSPSQHPTWTKALTDYLRQPNPADVPLFRLAHELKITILELMAIVLAAAVEEDARVGFALARVQAPLNKPRPTLSLIATAFAATAHDPSPIAALVNGNAISSGLLILTDTAAPLPEQTLSLPLHIYFGLGQRDYALATTTIGLGTIPPIPLPESYLAQAQQYAQSLQRNPKRVLVIRAAAFAEGRTIATEIATYLNQRPVFLESSAPVGLAPWLQLRQLLPVFCPDLSPSDRHILPAIPHYSGPILTICASEGGLEAKDRDLINWPLSVPNPQERQILWERLLPADKDTGETSADLAKNLAYQHRHSCDRIAQLSRLAQDHSALHQRSTPTAEDIRAAAWSGEGIGLDALATPLTQTIADEALVLPPALKQSLTDLLHRCQVRDTLTAGLGSSAITRYYPGVKALFVGPSGTGKTLAAGWLATQLQIPLYRVDLSAMISKYIGETEKNLSQLLAKAEQVEVILLFDEADSLFGKRTDVQQANDRFANTQTNYLLQRIETFDGITLLTSNSRQRLDSAFSRRLDMIIEFTPPRPQERRALWRSHLGDHHALTPADLNQLAATVDLSGGHIRNAVLAAAVIAQQANRTIQFQDIAQGIGAEYYKLGKQPPALHRSAE